MLADGEENVGFVTAELDLAHVEAARRKIPALTHDRLVEVELVSAGDGNVKQPSSHPSVS
jgi:predicted amidohydrolase